MNQSVTGGFRSRPAGLLAIRSDWTVLSAVTWLLTFVWASIAAAQTCGQFPVGILAGPITNQANQHSYFLLQPSCWTDAEATAVSMGGHLVTENDVAEDTWIENTFSSYGGIGRGLWIGLHDLDPTVNSTAIWNRSEEFGWVSGQPMWLHKWPSPGEPDTRTNTTEFYVEMLPPAQFWGWADKPNETMLNGLVEVPQPLEIRVQPAGVSVRIGDRLDLSAEGDGTSAISYQWQFMGTNLPGATKMAFSIENFQPAQAGTYSVVLSNNWGTLTSEPAIVIVRTVLAWNYPLNGPVATCPSSATNVIAIAGGADHALALRSDGTVIAWGDDYNGESEVPAGLTNVTAVAAGRLFSLALKGDGSVTSWGTNVVSPYVPADLTNILALSARDEHYLALRNDGTVAAWNEYGSNEPPVSPGLRSVAMVAAGAYHSVALKADGTVVAWGDNFYRQTMLPTGLLDIVAVAAGDNHALALKADGTVVGWGDTQAGQSMVPAGLADVVAIAAGGNLSMALRADGTVTSWGQLGQTLPWFPTIVAITAGDGFSLGLAGDQSPHFSVEPPRLVVDAGGEVLLGAKVVGLRPMSYQWQLNGTNLPGGTSDIYRIHNVALADAGVYTLIASNALGALSSREALVQILPKTNYPPILPKQLDRTINVRSRLVVTNTAIDPDGAADQLAYHLAQAPNGASIDSHGVITWSPSTQDVPSRNMFTTVVTDRGQPSQGATNTFTVTVLDWAQTGPASILEGPIVDPANGHRYFLLSPASWTDAESTAMAMGGHLVTINDQEEFLWVDSTFSRDNGTHLPLWIGLTDPNPSITWENSGFDVWMHHFVWASGQPITFFAWSSSGVPSLGVGRVMMIGGDWAEGADSTLLNGVVEIPVPLQIISQPRSLSVGIGRDVTLTVVADGTDLLHYQWRFMGTNLPGATGSSLTLVKVLPTQSGPYQVVVSNSQGVVTSDKAIVSVTGLVGWGLSIGGVLDAPAGATNVVAMSAGRRHAMALRDDGAIVAWGDNLYGETVIPAGLGPARAIAAGWSFSLALGTNGIVTAWGDNSLGQTNVPSDLTNVVGIAAGVNHSLAVRVDGTVAAWGSYAAPPAALSNVVSVAAGGIYDLALRADGTVVTWGSDVWDAFAASLTNVVAISTGPSHSLALLANGTVVAWGDNMFGQTNVPPLLTNVVAISAGGRHSMALTAGGDVVEWGEVIGDVARPLDLPNVVAIAGGDVFSLALLQDGAPHLTVQPQDQIVTLGGNPTFAAKAVGQQAMRYQWKFNGNDISGATRDTYSIAGAQLTNGGLYSLTLSNSVGTLASRQAKLIIMAEGTNRPVVLLQPLGLLAGQFRLRVNGTIGLKYVLEASTGLPNWIGLQTSSPPVMPFDLMDNGAVVSSNRFYRVRLEP